ncbi:MAG: N-acetylmuramoyl-L-alanine amidase [Candidatus Sumerlaeota bacterium]|nr:N-acetylmuramoyl-L-alanine amidase [Candidatus Sumerlaeota bacterium]
MIWNAAGARAAMVTQLSWDSKEQYNRFYAQFDENVRHNAVDALAEKGYFYVDIYGIRANYKRRLMEINDQTLRYVDALTYPDYSVLRFVFYPKDRNVTFNITTASNPARLVADTIRIGAGAPQQTGLPADAGAKKALALMPGAGTVSSPMAASDAIASAGISLKAPRIPEPRPQPAASQGKKKYIVIIDPGHGGANSGASSSALIGGRQVQEKELTLQFAYYLKKIIDNAPNMAAFLTRSSDKTLTLEERVKFAEDHTGDLFVSLHMNDGAGNPNARGIELFFLNDKGTVDGAVKAVEERENADGSRSDSSLKGAPPLLKTLLTDFQHASLENMQYESYLVGQKIENSFRTMAYYGRQQHIRGVKSANFLVLKNFSMPAVLAEIGFITNDEELRLLVNPQFQRAVAILIYNGICEYISENDPNFKPRALNISSAETMK